MKTNTRGKDDMRILKFLAWIILIGSGGWLVYEPGFEPGIGCIVALSSLIALHIKDRQRGKESVIQNQNVSGGSSGIQAGGNVHIGSIERHRDE